MLIHLEYGSNNRLDSQTLENVRTISQKHGSVSEKTWGMRSGAIDLVSILEISIAFAVTKAVEGYVEGLVGKQLFQELGEKTRAALVDRFSAATSYLRDLYHQVVKNNSRRYGAIVLIGSIQDITVYVVLNHEQASEDLVASIPVAFAKVAEFISVNGLPKDNPRTVQLFPNFQTQSWDYLLVPSTDSFGGHIDRYLDLRDYKYYRLTSAEEFLAKFPLGNFGDYKLIVSPIRDHGSQKFERL